MPVPLSRRLLPHRPQPWGFERQGFGFPLNVLEQRFSELSSGRALGHRLAVALNILGPKLPDDPGRLTNHQL